MTPPMSRIREMVLAQPACIAGFISLRMMVTSAKTNPKAATKKPK